MKPLPRSWFAGSAVEVARKLLGKVVRRGTCAGIIVETEAYAADPASHAFRITPRSAIVRDTYGYWYVYFTYGMHWCANVTTDAKGVGAVLIRAIEPIEGVALMKRRRRTSVVRNLCSGPAKFCEAFGITGKDNRVPLGGPTSPRLRRASNFARHTSPSVTGFAIYDAPEIAAKDIGVSGRIGITNGTELPWRFYIKGNPFVSRKR